MKLQLKYFFLGFIFACLAAFGIIAFFLFHDSGYRMIFHDQRLPSGTMIKVTSFNLVWGVEHDERTPGNDSFSLEYVSNIPQADQQARDQEALEVFELVRPVNEQWGFKRTSISAFRSARRKGPYDIYNFEHAPDGKWAFQRYPAKVFIND
jgi:hypothetical protein